MSECADALLEAEQVSSVLGEALGEGKVNESEWKEVNACVCIYI
jgi:hypothetical protein